MFKSGLLLSTAMTAVALLLSGADAAQAQTDMHVASRNPNTRFLCTYGQFPVSWFHSGLEGEDRTSWTHVAVPVTGHGKLVNSIVVQEGKSHKSADGKFFVGIYSNTASGLPGNLMAGGPATASSQCTEIEIPVGPIELQNNQTYWIEEQASQHDHTMRKLFWAVNPGTKRKAYVQHHSSSGAYSYTSPWTKQTSGPYFKLR